MHKIYTDEEHFPQSQKIPISWVTMRNLVTPPFLWDPSYAFRQSGQGVPMTRNFFKMRQMPQKRRQRMMRTEDDIVIQSEDLLQVATSVGGSGARVSAGAWCPIITKRLVLCNEVVRYIRGGKRDQRRKEELHTKHKN